MPRIARLFLVSAALVLAAGCGSDDPQIPTAPSTTSSPKQAHYPLTVIRSGGVAGFNDTLSIQKDGSVIASTKRGQLQCTLDDASLATLNQAALAIKDFEQPTPPATGTSDAMQLLFGAGGGRVSIDDPRVAEAEPVITQLLEDVTGPEAERKICT